MADGGPCGCRIVYRKEGSSSSWRLVEVTEAPPPASEDEDEEPDPCPLEIMGVILSGGQNSPELREAQTHFGQGTLGCLDQLVVHVDSPSDRGIITTRQRSRGSCGLRRRSIPWRRWGDVQTDLESKKSK